MTADWSWTDLVREHGEDAAFHLLSQQTGYGKATPDMFREGCRAGQLSARDASNCLLCGAVVADDALCGCQK